MEGGGGGLRTVPKLYLVINYEGFPINFRWIFTKLSYGQPTYHSAVRQKHTFCVWPGYIHCPEWTLNIGQWISYWMFASVAFMFTSSASDFKQRSFLTMMGNHALVINFVSIYCSVNGKNKALTSVNIYFPIVSLKQI